MNEINNRTAGSAIKKSFDQGRDIQSKNIIINAINNINKKYSFSTNINGTTFTFSATATSSGLNGRKFYIVVNTENHSEYLKINKFGRLDYDYNSTIGYAITNLRAGERFKLKNMISAIQELEDGYNNAYTQQVNEAILKKLIRESIRKVLNESLRKKELNIFMIPINSNIFII